ncbi:hypothetical protein V1634_16560 [Plantactinospora veratri]|uniref:DUF3558 domain-containing protein n=1 Tax=Plantactinospora veratri TaxID=1436122 RepID=A0ABU7SEU4_9ACTN
MRYWTSVRSLLVVCCLLTLTACTDGEPKRSDDAGLPAPTVSESEMAERIGVYAERIQDEVLDPTFTFPPKWEVAQSAPQPATCADLPVKGPDWGVVPARDYDINVASEDESKYVEAVKTWLGKNGFTELSNSAEPSATASAEPTGAGSLSARSADGISVRLDVDVLGTISLAFHGPCAWPSNRPNGPTPSALPPMPTPSWPIQAAADELACEKPERYAYNPKGKRYAGKGPHWITLVQVGRDEERHGGKFFIPSEWQPWVRGEAYGTLDRSRVQLVACLTATPGAPTGRQVTCQFETRAVNFALYEATYHVSVREAATGRQVASFSFPGTLNDQDSCPSLVVYRPGDGILRGIDVDAFHAALRPLVKPAK